MSEDTDSGVFTLATQGSITFFGNVLGKGLGFLFVAVATRLVTPAEYGVFTLGLSVVMFIQGFASLNIYRAVDFFVPRFLSDGNYGQAKKTLQNVFTIGIGTSVLGAVVVFLARDQLAVLFDEPDLSIVLLLFVLLIPLQTINRALLASFNSIKKMKYRVLMRDFLNPLIRTLGAIVFVVGGAGLVGLVGGYLLGITVAILCGAAFLLYEADWIRTSSSESVSNRSLLSYSLPLVFAGVIYSLVGQIDYFVIGYFRSSAEVGQYRIAYLLSTNLLIVLSAITPVFKPMVAENRSDNALLQSRYRLATRWVTMLTLPLAITLILAPEAYISLLFTEEYVTASAAVIALTIGYLLNAASGPEGMVLEGLGHTRLTLFNTLVLVGINGVLDVLLVPQFGILGAGIATGSALAITGFVGVLEIYLLRSIHPYTYELLHIWVAATLPITGGWILISFVDRIIQIVTLLPLIVGICYLAGLRALSCFSDDDQTVFLHLKQKLILR